MLNKLIDKMKASKKETASLKQYFFDFIEFTKVTKFGRGCLVSNTADEIGEDADKKMK